MKPYTFISIALFLALGFFIAGSANAYQVQPGIGAFAFCTADQQAADQAIGGSTIYYTGVTHYCTGVTVMRVNGNTCPEGVYDTATRMCEMGDIEPEACLEAGQSFDNGACVDTCANGGTGLDGICLNPTEDPAVPNPSDDGGACEPSKPDYKGTFQGKHYCDSNLPEPPTCSTGSVQIADGGEGSYGFACSSTPPPMTPEEATKAGESSTTTTTNPDGSTTETTTKTDGSGNTTTTETTTNPDGSTTTKNTGEAVDSQTGGPCLPTSLYCVPKLSDQGGICDGNTLCKDVGDIKNLLDGIGSPEGSPTAERGSFDMAGAELAYENAKTDFAAQIDIMQAEIEGLFDVSLTADAIQCGEGVVILGRTINICPAQYKAELAVIGQIVLLICSILSLVIIFR